MRRPKKQETMLLTFNGTVGFSNYIYLPFEVDEIIVKNGHQIFTNNVRFMTVSSNLFGIGEEPIPLDTFDYLNGEYSNIKPTSIQFSNTNPINGSYNFNFICKDNDHNIITPSEIKLELTFIRF